MANECIPEWPSTMITAVAGTGGVTGKKFVANSGALAVGLGTDGGVATVIIPAASGNPVSGVAAQDTAATFAVGIFVRGTVPVTAGATLTAGTQVMSDATGAAIPWTTGHAVAGVCMGDTASAADAQILLG